MGFENSALVSGRTNWPLRSQPGSCEGIPNHTIRLSPSHAAGTCGNTRLFLSNSSVSLFAGGMAGLEVTVKLVCNGFIIRNSMI